MYAFLNIYSDYIREFIRPDCSKDHTTYQGDLTICVNKKHNN